jgi:hypothetical protein
MITSLFLLFVASGILIGSIIVGFGTISAIFAGLAGIGAMALVAAYFLLKRDTAS